uniref:Uncharacterized protein n=1 Tax=Peronospora matthiolae TaxID=2874970 RepID=A0AAV1TH50_9STRA
MNAGEAVVSARSTSPPVDLAPVTYGVRFPPVVTAVSTAPADVDSAITKNPADGRTPMSTPPVDVVALFRRVEAYEGSLALMSPSPHNWSLRCESLERELRESSAIVSQLRKKMQHKMVLTSSSLANMLHDGADSTD